MSSSPVVAAARILYGPVSVGPDLADLPTSRLTPEQHASLLLPPGSKGMLVLGRRGREAVVSRTGERSTRSMYRQVGAKADELPATVRAFLHGGEILVALNAFRVKGTFGGSYAEWPDRRLPNLLHLRACWVELDFYKRGEWRRRSAEEMVWQVLDRCREKGIPVPSYIVASGRGLHVVWLTEGVPSIALPAWAAVQRSLSGTFKDMGPDTVAANPCGNQRLVGTSNRGVDVRMLWPATVGEIRRYVFRALSADILPYTPEQCREHREKRRERTAVRRAAAARSVASGASPRLDVGTYKATMEADLWKVFDHRYPEGVRIRTDEDDDGSHGRFLYAFAKIWAANAGSGDELQAQVELHAQRLGYRSPKHAVAEAGSIIRRVRQIFRGEARRNRPGTGYYRFGPRRLVDEFGITEAEARDLDLRMLVPAEMKRERVAERQRKTRLAKGATPRTEVASARLDLGRRALAMREAEGLSRPQLCARLGVKPTLLDKALREAKAAVPAAPAKPAPKAKPRLPAAGRASSLVSSRYIAIVAEAADEAPNALEAGMASAYTQTVRDEAPPHEDPRPVTPSEAGGPSHVGPRPPVVPDFIAKLRRTA
ncbi:hypothetical protein [Methylorubrum sp. DB1722]|uniref:hypothetical protein n=1 Tax=Methylorubrum sp. DB1722 TaxID=2478916 RepID=UPI0018E35012|nr:hypothetical protein [Methylorubrum sp. DB1722]